MRYASDDRNPSRRESPDARHRFSVGQHVTLAPAPFDRAPQTGTFEIMALLPASDGERQYRIKHGREAFERMVGEYRLRSAI
jgi:hypothetical protein